MKTDRKFLEPTLFPPSGQPPAPKLRDVTEMPRNRWEPEPERPHNLWVHVRGHDRILVAPKAVNYVYANAKGEIDSNRTGFPDDATPIATARTNDVMVCHLRDVRPWAD